MKKKFCLIIILIIYLLVIFMFSHQDAVTSTSTSDIIVNQIKKIDTLSKFDLSFIVRKSAHFFVFGGLGLVFYLNYSEYFSNKRLLFFVSIISVIIYACFDEIHQTFISGRSGQFSDVLLDSVGAFIVICMYIIINKRLFINRD